MEFYSCCPKLSLTGNSEEIMTIFYLLRIIDYGQSARQSRADGFPPLHHRGQESHKRGRYVLRSDVQQTFGEYRSRDTQGILSSLDFPNGILGKRTTTS